MFRLLYAIGVILLVSALEGVVLQRIGWYYPLWWAVPNFAIVAVLEVRMSIYFVRYLRAYLIESRRLSPSARWYQRLRTTRRFSWPGLLIVAALAVMWVVILLNRR